MTRTHKASGWTRTSVGHGHYTITPTDGSGPRTVAFMSAHSWSNLPNDDRALLGEHRVVLVAGEPLPAWAQAWLTDVNRRQCERANEALRAAIDDADNAPFRDDGSY